MIDPKTLELAAYDGIPHLLAPWWSIPSWPRTRCGGPPERWSDATRCWLGTGSATSISSTPSSGARWKDRPKLDEEDVTPLPYIVVVIDELADLMMVSSADVEESITRLAQMARAVGIHLIIATQRPSVDVITGVIKANFPSRISFRVASKTDSRTILDGNGAEQLLGNGDMLFLPPGGSRLVRVHGPYISEREADALAQYLKRRGQPVYQEDVTKAEEKEAEGGVSEEDNEVYLQPSAWWFGPVRPRSPTSSGSSGWATAGPHASWT